MKTPKNETECWCYGTSTAHKESHIIKDNPQSSTTDILNDHISNPEFVKEAATLGAQDQNEKYSNTDWREEFEKQFANGFYNGEWVLFYCPTSEKNDEHPATEEEVKDFISQLLEAERKRTIKWLKARCEANIKAFGTNKWNSDMEDLIAVLQKLS